MIIITRIFYELFVKPTSLCLQTKVRKMAGPDVAEQVDDMICVMDKVVGSQMDTIIILLVGWLLFGAVIFLVSHLIYSTISTEPASSVSTIPLLSVSPPSDLPEVTGADENHVNYVKVNVLHSTDPESTQAQHSSGHLSSDFKCDPWKTENSLQSRLLPM